MPRIPPSLLRAASSRSPYLPPLLLPARSLSSAISELRWLISHARTRSRLTSIPFRSLLRSYILHRRRHVPLQYILGTEHFGPLELRVRRGVLIPRAETASITSYLAERIGTSSLASENLAVLDLCTGSGCIALLLAHLLPSATVIGIDTSPAALALAEENRLKAIAPEIQTRVEFAKADVLGNGWEDTPPLQKAVGERKWDVLVANPPYISPRGYRSETGLSVRRYEPEEALVPPPLANGDVARGDAFYPAIVGHAEALGIRAVMVEVGDAKQAVRVAMLMEERLWDGKGAVEIWRDHPEGKTTEGETYDKFPVRGEGNVRAVFAVKDTADWGVVDDEKPQ